MHVCKSCGQDESVVRFRTTTDRGHARSICICRSCEAEDARERRRKHREVEQVVAPNNAVRADQPAPPQQDAQSPLREALNVRAASVEKSELRASNRALTDEVVRLQQELDAAKSVKVSPEIIVYERAKEDRCDAVACCIASDWHVEEPVQKAEVHGLNEYNLDIAKSRAEKFFKNSLRLAEIYAKESQIKTLYCAFLGDFFSGWIHEELLANTLLAPADSANFVKGLLCSGIDFWLRESSFKIQGDMIPGNHGRLTDKVHHGNPTGTSLESFMYAAIADRYHNNPRVDLKVSQQAMVYRSFFEKFKMRLIHGYEVKYGGGVGGITIPLRKALAAWNEPIRADLTVLGHFHQFFDGGDFLVNGSLIGYNTFAQAIKAKYEEARQAFFLVHARRGGQKTGSNVIWLD